MTKHILKNFHAKKSFGQNFLTDPNIIQKILKVCDIKKDDTILEIGPGKGALTKHLVQLANKIIAIEKDLTLANYLKKELEGEGFELIRADFLKYPLNELPQNIKIVGNLPYNVATAIIEKILLSKIQFESLYVMVQKEHALRICATPGNKSYGSFSLFVQYHAEAKILFPISPNVFSPAPKVTSAFLRITQHENATHFVKDEKHLFEIIHTAFHQRRKKVLNALSAKYTKEIITPILDQLKLDHNLRAENLTLENYIAISKLLIAK